MPAFRRTLLLCLLAPASLGAQEAPEIELANAPLSELWAFLRLHCEEETGDYELRHPDRLVTARFVIDATNCPRIVNVMKMFDQEE